MYNKYYTVVWIRENHLGDCYSDRKRFEADESEKWNNAFLIQFTKKVFTRFVKILMKKLHFNY